MKKTKVNRKRSERAKLLKKLVLAAQAGDSAAIEMLCQLFKPLIKKEAFRSYILQALDEDAENTAWEIFLDIVMHYHKKSFLRFPGFIKTNLRYELFHKAFRGVSVTDCSSLESEQELKAKDLAVVDDKLFLESIENKSLVEYLLSKLTEKQRKVIQAIYFDGHSIMQFHKQHGISYKVAFTHHQAALKKMHKLLLALKS